MALTPPPSVVKGAETLVKDYSSKDHDVIQLHAMSQQWML